MTSLQFISLSPERRALAFEQAAAQRSVSAVIIEKEFWVSWLLRMLASSPELEPHLVLKGGTSLSKVFGVIDRFSEDVDLSVSPEFVGADAEAFERLTSRTQRDAAIDDMQRLCRARVRDTIAPVLDAAVREALGSPTGGEWLRLEDGEDTAQPILDFHYPTTQATGSDYIRRVVKLELGTLTDQQPVGRHPIRPLVADEFPSLFEDWRCEVIALDLGRTFWEKATILHAECHRPEGSPIPDRYARHYSDLARLLKHSQATAFMSDNELCARVAKWKSLSFSRSWAQYDLARHGTFRLTPPPPRQVELARDYEAMRPMFLSEPPSFEAVMADLASAERTINSL